MRDDGILRCTNCNKRWSRHGKDQTFRCDRCGSVVRRVSASKGSYRTTGRRTSVIESAPVQVGATMSKPEPVPFPPPWADVVTEPPGRRPLASRASQRKTPKWQLIFLAVVAGWIIFGTIFARSHNGTTGTGDSDTTNTSATACEQWWTDHHRDGLGIEPYESHDEFVNRCAIEADTLTQDVIDYLQQQNG